MSARFILLLLVSLAACAEQRSFDLTRGGVPTYVDEADPAVRDAAAGQVGQAVIRGIKELRLQPGDTIEASFFASRAATTREYRLAVGDQIEVVLPYQPTLTHTYTVRPDGRISLLLRGDIRASGQRPADLARQITAQYSNDFVDPSATVNVQRFSTESEDFLTTISGSAGPRAQTLPIAPDGTVTLPALRSIHAAGHTVDELAQIADQAYAQKFGNVTTSLRLGSVANLQVFVFGEVLRPGPTAAPQGRTVLQLVAAAGGPTEFASLEAVRVLYWDQAGQPRIRQVNLNNVLTKLSLEEDMIVPTNAVVFVPPSQLAKAARYVDLVLRRLLAFSGTTAGVQFNVGGPATR